MSVYEIRVKGHLDQHWSSWFEGLTISHDDDGNTVLRGTLVDEAGEAIIAKLQKAADLSNENCDRAMKLAHKLSMQLRAAEDRVNQLEAEVELLRDRAVRAERWLQTIQKEIEEKLIAPRSANATEQTSLPQDAKC